MATDTALDALPAEMLGPILERERARRSLIDFCEYVDPRYVRARHLEILATSLESVERRATRKIAISMPPRHGKTELISRKFVAWYLGRHPDHHVILALYGAELAESNSRAVRSIVSDDRYPFDGVTLREDSRSVGRWQTQAGGVLVAVGVGGSLTGFGGDLIVCDDLVKDRAEAESAAIRASTSAWFSDVLRTRAHPGAVMVLVGTRWHQDDIIGEVTRRA
jgi:hypothetical protein